MPHHLSKGTNKDLHWWQQVLVNQWQDQFWNCKCTPTSEHSLMQVPKPELGSSLVKGGEHRSLNQVGKAKAEISDRQKLWDSSSWSCLSHSQAVVNAILRFLAIAEGLRKAGGQGEVATSKSMKCSSLSTMHASNTMLQWLPNICQVPTTLQMDLLEVDT